MKSVAVAAIYAVLTLSCSAHTADEKLLSHSAAVLNKLARKPEDAVPNAVLNRTQCLVLAPPASGAAIRRGIASCRKSHDHWGAPALVSVASENDASLGAGSGDLLLFVLNPGAARSLSSGELRLQGPHADSAGLLARSSPVVTDLQLSSAVLSYRKGSRFVGVVFHGNVRVDNKNSRPSTGQLEKFSTALTSYFNTIRPEGIVIHHTGIIPGSSKIPGSEAEVDVFHAERGMDVECFGREYHVAYHYLIFPNGSVKAGRPERCEGAHAKGHNSYLGIALVGDFSSADNPEGQRGLTQPTPKQVDALVRLCRKLRARYHIPLQHIVRHSDVSSTDCPGDRFPFASILQRIAAG